MKERLKISALTLEEAKKVFPQKNPSDIVVKLPIDSALKPVDEEYVCSLCNYIVFDSSCCGSCLQHNCSLCIKNHLLRSELCPNMQCNQVYKSTAKIHPKDQTELAKIQIKCPSCKKIYGYSDALAHAVDCQRPKVPCIFKCGYEKKFRTADSLLLHITTECLLAPLQCEICDAVENRQTKD